MNNLRSKFRLLLVTVLLGIVTGATNGLAGAARGDRPAKPDDKNQMTTPAPRTSPVQSPAASPEAGERVNRQVVSSGAVAAAGSNFGLAATLGQNASTFAAGAGYRVQCGFWQSENEPSCCLGQTGNANGEGGDVPTIGDISLLIDAKFLSGTCGPHPLPTDPPLIGCLAEADVNQSGGADPTCGDISIGDISTLVDYLFITGPAAYGPLPECL